MGQKPNVITISNTTAQTVGSNGLGFRLEPLTNAATGNPVDMKAAVRINRNDALIYRLTDDGPRYFSEPFEVLEIVGGTLGDQWLVTVFEGVADGVGAPGRVRRQPSIIAEKTSFASHEVDGTTLYLPGANGSTQVADINSEPRAFDVSRFRALHLYAGARAAGEGTMLTVNLQVAAGEAVSGFDEAPGNALLSLYDGWQGIIVASETQGATPPDVFSDLDGFIVVPFRPCWVRVSFVVTGPQYRELLPGTYIRLVGLE